MSDGSLGEVFGKYQHLTEDLAEQKADIDSKTQTLDSELDERKRALLGGDSDASTGNPIHDALVVFYGKDIVNQPQAVERWEGLYGRFEGKVGQPFLAIDRRISHHSFLNRDRVRDSRPYVIMSYHFGAVSETPIVFSEQGLFLAPQDLKGAAFKIDRFGSHDWRGDGLTDIPQPTDTSIELAYRRGDRYEDLITTALDVALVPNHYYVYGSLSKEEAELPAMEIHVGDEAIQTWLKTDDNSEHYLRIRKMCHITGVDSIEPPDRACRDVLNAKKDSIRKRLESVKETRDSGKLDEEIADLETQLEAV